MPTYNNRETVTFGDEQIEVIASNGACAIYADQFRDHVDEPWTGRLKQDIMTLYELQFTALGINPRDPSEEGGVEEAGHSLDYEDVPQVVGIVWAMASAAGSTRLGYESFKKRFESAPSSYREFGELFNTLVIGLAQRAFFRVEERSADAE